MKKKKGTSQYQGVYYSSDNRRWVVELERHERHPGFCVERDAGIYAEYCYRNFENKAVNFPELSDAEVSAEYERVMAQREMEQAQTRSAARQGPKKNIQKTSKYVGVFLKRNSQWVARIQYRGKSTQICAIHIDEDNAEARAAMAYDEKALEIYGENAKLNFPIKAGNK